MSLGENKREYCQIYRAHTLTKYVRTVCVCVCVCVSLYTHIRKYMCMLSQKADPVHEHKIKHLKGPPPHQDCTDRWHQK